MNRIEDQANYFKNIPLRDRKITAVVHLEDTADEQFWNNQLQNIKSGKYHFIHYSRSPKGGDARGCEQCLRYLPYCEKSFFVCIDSDFRHLLKEDILQTGKYFAQTYTYSWENHYCEARHLQERFLIIDPTAAFDFKAFISQFSKIVFKPLQFLLSSIKNGGQDRWNISAFNRCIPLQMSREDLTNNGEKYLKRIKDLFEQTIGQLPLPEQYYIENLTPDNAYLHIQGHHLYKLIMHIGTMICRGKGIAFKSQILDMSAQTEGYNEIELVQSALKRILQNNQSNQLGNLDRGNYGQTF